MNTNRSSIKFQVLLAFSNIDFVVTNTITLLTLDTYLNLIIFSNLMVPYIDAHCHVDVYEDIAEKVENAKKADVKIIVNNGLDVKTNRKTLELSKQYYEDSKYYLDKKDYFTSFGCINYAHGLLDAIIKF